MRKSQRNLTLALASILFASCSTGDRGDAAVVVPTSSIGWADPSELPRLDGVASLAEVSFEDSRSLADLVGLSDAIVVGVTDSTERIESPIKVVRENVRVERVLFELGTAPKSIAIDWSAFNDNGKATTFAGAPLPVKGDRVVLFLRAVDSRWTVVNSSSRLVVSEDDRLTGPAETIALIPTPDLAEFGEAVAAVKGGNRATAEQLAAEAEAERALYVPVAEPISFGSISRPSLMTLVATERGFCYGIDGGPLSTCFPFDGGIGESEVLPEWRDSTIVGIVGPSVSAVEITFPASLGVSVTVAVRELVLPGGVVVRVFAHDSAEKTQGAFVSPLPATEVPRPTPMGESRVILTELPQGSIVYSDATLNGFCLGYGSPDGAPGVCLTIAAAKDAIVSGRGAAYQVAFDDTVIGLCTCSTVTLEADGREVVAKSQGFPRESTAAQAGLSYFFFEGLGLVDLEFASTS